MKYIAFVLTALLVSCSFHTDISYRLNKADEYVREDGYMINCGKDGRFFVVGTYTPDTWGEDAYYGFLGGKTSGRKVQITSLDLLFIETSDTLALHKVDKARTYYYTARDLDEVLDSNKKLKVTVHFTDMVTGQNERREYILTRRKHTYSTGTFPHG